VHKKPFEGMLNSLGNQYLMGQDNYPKTLMDAYSLMTGWQERKVGGNGGLDGVACTHISRMEEAAEDDEGTVLTTTGKGKRGGFDKSKVTCNHADHKKADADHKKADGSDNKKGVSMMTVGIALAAEAAGAQIEKDWLLLDNQANVDVFMNGDLLTNIHRVSGSLAIHSNSGVPTTDMEGDVKGYGTVWYDPDGIANILSFNRVVDCFEVDYNKKADQFELVRPDKSIRFFKRSPAGLYFLKVEVGTVLVNTLYGQGMGACHLQHPAAIQQDAGPLGN
jgi:hypothetical protein